jgi:hypothetical protein
MERVPPLVQRRVILFFCPISAFAGKRANVFFFAPAQS